ncbi:MAG: hypothetical protein WCG85_24495 [Polyangia bacterium]
MTRALHAAATRRTAWAIAVILFSPPAAAQPADRVVTAEAPVVNGNAVVAKQRALADAFRQVVERAFADLLKESGGEAQPLSPGLAQIKATFANRGQRFVRSYRVLDEEEGKGRLRVQIDAEVDTALLRREMERARATAAPEPATTVARPAGPSLLVGGDDEASIVVVKALAAGGVQAQSAAARDEAALVAAAGRQAAQALWLVATSFGEGTIRGASPISVRCELRARLLSAGPGAGPALLDNTQSERGFAGDESAARLACWQRVAGGLARQLSTFLRPVPAGARYLTLDLDVIEPAALMTLIRVVKRLGAVNAAEVRQVTTRRAEIRVFTRMSGREIESALIRDIAGRLLVTEVKPPADRVTLQVRLAQADEPLPAAGAEPPATKP